MTIIITVDIYITSNCYVIASEIKIELSTSPSPCSLLFNLKKLFQKINDFVSKINCTFFFCQPYADATKMSSHDYKCEFLFYILFFVLELIHIISNLNYRYIMETCHLLWSHEDLVCLLMTFSGYLIPSQGTVWSKNLTYLVPDIMDI